MLPPVNTTATRRPASDYMNRARTHHLCKTSFRATRWPCIAAPDVHRRKTAVETWDDTRGLVDAFVAGGGTGGTITGVGEALKQRKPAVRIVAVEPAGAAVLSGGPAGQHQMPGIGVGFIPEVLHRGILDEVITVTDEEAFACARRLAREEGIVAGVSSGAALHAALHLAARPQAAGQLIVALLADTGERYLATKLFDTA